MVNYYQIFSLHYLSEYFSESSHAKGTSFSFLHFCNHISKSKMLKPLPILRLNLSSATVLNPSFENPAVTSDTIGCPSFWSEGVKAMIIRTGSNKYGGIIAADGNQLVALTGFGAFIKQSVAFTSGITYLLTFSAASGDTGEASLTVTVGDAELVVEPLTSMATYSMWFVADAISKAITISSSWVFLDSLTVQQSEACLFILHLNIF